MVLIWFDFVNEERAYFCFFLRFFFPFYLYKIYSQCAAAVAVVAVIVSVECSVSENKWYRLNKTMLLD